MELARNSTSNLDISAEADLISFTYDGDTAKEIVIRADLGTEAKPIAGGGTYEMVIYLNDVRISPAGAVQVDSGITETILVSRPLPIEPGDVVRVTTQGRPADTAIATTTTIRDITAMREDEIFGAGPIIVDQDYGGTDTLSVKTEAGVGIEGADIHVYNASDYAAGNRSNAFVVGRTVTTQNGRWTRSLMLFPGDYTLVVFKIGVYAPTTMALTVSE